jgi:hypothetical protein
MKRSLNHERNYMTGLILLLLLLFSACQHETHSLSEEPDDEKILANAGDLHNQMILHYYSCRKEQAPDPEAMFSELLALSSDYLISLGYDANSIGETRNCLEQKLGPSFLKSASGGDYTLDPSTFMMQLQATGLYSKDFLGQIDAIIQLGMDQEKEKIRHHVNTSFSGLKFHSKTDRQAQQLFVKIFNGSYEFWEKYYRTNLKGVHLKDSSWVIINDGIGGLIGLIFGPAGSIITATVFSVGTNEEIKG